MNSIANFDDKPNRLDRKEQPAKKSKTFFLETGCRGDDSVSARSTESITHQVLIYGLIPEGKICSAH
jgi:hypothetical protein